jgi:hypothetical protein
LEGGIIAKLLGLSPMMNLRFTIYDLRLASENKRRRGFFPNPQSATPLRACSREIGVRNPQFVVPSFAPVRPA